MFNNFTYYTPTKVIFGNDAEKNLGDLIKDNNCNKVLVVYGGKSVLKNGVLKKVTDALLAKNVNFVELNGVVPNPKLSKVYEGIELAKKENVDFILAVGGGSVIDTAKAIAFGIANDDDVWDIIMGKAQPKKCAPVATVLTIAAAGSEMSMSLVITKDETNEKRGLDNDLCRPRFSIMNPTFTKTLPDYQTQSGCTDILMHTMERYFTNGEHLELTDNIAEALMRTVIKNAVILHEDPFNDQGRAEIMWAGSLSHNGLTGCGIKSGDFTCHMLEHELGGMYDVTHGAGLAAVWGTWAKYVYKDALPRFVRFARNVMNVSDTNISDEEFALKGIVALEDFFRRIGMPTNLRELGINPTEEEFVSLAKNCAIATGGECGSAKKLYEKDMYNIYKLAK